MHDDERSQPLIYLGPRAFAIALCVVCACIAAFSLGFERLTAFFSTGPSDALAVRTIVDPRTLLSGAASPPLTAHRPLASSESSAPLAPGVAAALSAPLRAVAPRPKRAWPASDRPRASTAPEAAVAAAPVSAVAAAPVAASTPTSQHIIAVAPPARHELTVAALKPRRIEVSAPHVTPAPHVVAAGSTRDIIAPRAAASTTPTAVHQRTVAVFPRASVTAQAKAARASVSAQEKSVAHASVSAQAKAVARPSAIAQDKSVARASVSAQAKAVPQASAVSRAGVIPHASATPHAKPAAAPDATSPLLVHAAPASGSASSSDLLVRPTTAALPRAQGFSPM